MLVENRQFFHTLLHSTPPLGGSRWNSATPFDVKKTRMAWLRDGETIWKIYLFVLAKLTNVTDRQTDRHRMPAIAALCIASHGNKTANVNLKKKCSLYTS